MNCEINKTKTKKSNFFQLNHDGNFENIKKLKGPSILRNKTYKYIPIQQEKWKEKPLINFFRQLTLQD